MEFDIHALNSDIIEKIVNTLHINKIQRSKEYFEKCLDEQNNCIRNTYIACMDDVPVGIAHLLLDSHYPAFNQNKIPEINDLLVVQSYQRQGIGESLVKACENLAIKKGYSSIGLGVGLYKDYGSAQRLYFRLGYKPDGYGLMYRNEPVPPGTSVFVDDDLLIYLIKDLKG